MAAGWVRSLSCRSASRDVVEPSRRRLPFACNGAAVKDVVGAPPRRSTNSTSSPASAKHRLSPGRRPKLSKSVSLQCPSPAPSSALLTLAELPLGHSSRRVVELIFTSTWAETDGGAAFPGEIEILFRVHNAARTVARFEEYRDAVRSRAGAGAMTARCAADGNEMMRFQCPGGSNEVYDAGVATCKLRTGAGGEKDVEAEGIRTFSGSGRAHENAGGGGGGRRAMLVCRVIAGRVGSSANSESSTEWDSLYRGKGELVVFDRRAVLPCFLIIYKLFN